MDTMTPLRILAFLAGLAIVLGTLYSTVRVFVVPRSENDKIARMVFSAMRKVFDGLMAPSQVYSRRDHIMAFGQTAVAEVRSQEPGPAGNNDSHVPRF